ncbi:MAG TPA: FHA domain-containing protein [Ilumatobacteraceae bacterium]|nr:FHA domain-containing protein [Ilumatobacteraceae bacterium]
MTDQVLNLLKFVLLGLLYLFFARVLWAVWSEVRTPSRRPMAGAPRAAMAPTTPTPRPTAAPAPAPSRRQDKKRAKRRVSRLVMLEPKSRRGLTVPVVGDVTLGREPGCTITIDDDAYVSQLHLRVFDYDGQPMVEDLGSTNGTYHNGAKLVGAKLLHPGDRIQVGTTVIEAQ